jgi:hypothetical protein
MLQPWSALSVTNSTLTGPPKGLAIEQRRDVDTQRHSDEAVGQGPTLDEGGEVSTVAATRRGGVRRWTDGLATISTDSASC